MSSESRDRCNKIPSSFSKSSNYLKGFLSGLTLEDILKAADWSSHGVFQKFCYVPKRSLSFDSTVLVDTVTSTKSHVVMETKHSEDQR